MSQAIQVNESDRVAPFRFWINISKIDKKAHVIAGYASVEMVDVQDELVPLETLKKSWELFIKDLDYAHIHVMHSNIPIGKVLLEFKDSEDVVWKSGVDDVGLFIVVKVRGDIKKGREVWKLIEAGVLKGFSIGGEAILKTPVEDEKGVYNRIDTLELHEISVVTNPANQLSMFNILKFSDNDAITKMSVGDLKTKLMSLYGERAIIEEILYPHVKEQPQSDSSGMVEYAPNTEDPVSKELCVKLKAKLSIVNMEIFACEEALRKKMLRELAKFEGGEASNTKLIGDETQSKVQEESKGSSLLEKLDKSGGDPASVENAPISESNKPKEENKMTEEKKAENSETREDKLIALIKGFSDAASKLMIPDAAEKKAEEITPEDKKEEEKKADPCEDDEEEVASKKKKKETKKTDEDSEEVAEDIKEPVFNEAKLQKSVEDLVEKRLAELGVTAVKKSVALP